MQIGNRPMQMKVLPENEYWSRLRYLLIRDYFPERLEDIERRSHIEESNYNDFNSIPSQSSPSLIPPTSPPPCRLTPSPGYHTPASPLLEQRGGPQTPTGEIIGRRRSESIKEQRGEVSHHLFSRSHSSSPSSVVTEMLFPKVAAATQNRLRKLYPASPAEFLHSPSPYSTHGQRSRPDSSFHHYNKKNHPSPSLDPRLGHTDWRSMRVEQYLATHISEDTASFQELHSQYEQQQREKYVQQYGLNIRDLHPLFRGSTNIISSDNDPKEFLSWFNRQGSSKISASLLHRREGREREKRRQAHRKSSSSENIATSSTQLDIKYRQLSSTSEASNYNASKCTEAGKIRYYDDDNNAVIDTQHHLSSASSKIALSHAKKKSRLSPSPLPVGNREDYGVSPDHANQLLAEESDVVHNARSTITTEDSYLHPRGITPGSEEMSSTPVVTWGAVLGVPRSVAASHSLTPVTATPPQIGERDYK
eukprot:jgi/Bigna1/137750/aug1.41_g12458